MMIQKADQSEEIKRWRNRLQLYVTVNQGHMMFAEKKITPEVIDTTKNCLPKVANFFEKTVYANTATSLALLKHSLVAGMKKIRSNV
jgi:hypothetical protein